MDLIKSKNKLGSNFVRPIEPINRLIQTQSKLLQHTIHKKKKKKKIERFLARKGVLFGGALWAWTLCAEVVLAIQHLFGCCILRETSQRRSAPVTKFSQPRAWIFLKKASATPQSKLWCVIPFFILIIFRSIIQFLVVLFPLLLWLLHQNT